MTVSVTIDGSGPYPFVVDTGSERTIVSRELASQLALRSAGPGTVHSITQTRPVDLVHVASLEMKSHRSTDLRAPIMDAANLGGAGLIGIDSLQRRQVTIDFKKRQMTIQPPANPNARLSNSDVVVEARKRQGRLVIMDASVDGERVAVILDTGSQITLGNEALRQKLFSREGRRPAEAITVRDVTGGRLPATYTKTDVLRIASIRLKQMPIALADAPVFRELGFDDTPALLLGMDALKLFDKVSIDFVRRTARFVLPETGARFAPIRMASIN
jgi:predicted aspartyl protease